MYHLKLCKSLSYSNGKVTATKQRPDVFVDDKATADAAVASGYFKLAEENGGKPLPDPPQEPEDRPGKTLEEMTVAELETFAAYKGVSLKGVRGKDNVIAALKEALGAEETENEVDYGSPTMTGLQEQ